jgi:hypothetical protein
MNSTPPPETDLPELAVRISELPPSCGPARLVGVDGHAGSGKSTFAARLAETLGGAPVLHLDDLATHEEFFDWTDRFRRQVLDPFERGEAARYDPYDWNLRRFGAARVLEPAPVVLIEGVGAGRRALRPSLALLLWMELDAEASWVRGRQRDGRLDGGGDTPFHRGPVEALRRHPGTPGAGGVRVAPGARFGSACEPRHH